MELNTHNTLKGRFKVLPKAIQNLILSDSLQQTIESIGVVNGVDRSKAATIEDETVLVLMGLEPPSDYAQNLVQHAGLKEEQANKISVEVTNKIFTPIAADLRSLIERELEEEDQENNQNAQPTIQNVQINKVVGREQAALLSTPVVQRSTQNPRETRTEASDARASIRKQVRENKHTVNIKDFLNTLQ